jgi:PhnB protein
MPNTVNPIPTGFHSLTVHLNVDGAAAYMDFLQKAFGAVEINRSPGPGGKLMHVLAKVGDSMMMFADDFSQEFHMPPFVKGNLPVVLNLYVQDADATFAQAVAAGCEVKMPLADQFWGDRTGCLEDPFGHRWWLAQHIEDLTPEDLQKRSETFFSQMQPVS